MILRLLLADVKIIVRDRFNLFWALAFPMIFIGVFALFNLDDPPDIEIALVNRASGPLADAVVRNLNDVELFDVEERQDEARTRTDLEDGDFDILLILPEGLGTDPSVEAMVIYGESNPQGTQLALNSIRRFFDEFNLEASGAGRAVTLSEQSVSTRDVGYMDFLVPGILGMGLMNYSIIGIATLLVGYHEKRILRRIQVTPLPVPVFVVAQVGAYLALSLVQAGVILGVGALVGAELTSNAVWVLPLVVAGNFVFLNVGIVVAATSKTVSAAAGMGNAIALPMMFLSGTFFPTDQLPRFMEAIVTYLPLTALLKCLRVVLLDNDSLWTAGSDLALLGAWAAVAALLAARAFKLD